MNFSTSLSSSPILVVAGFIDPKTLSIPILLDKLLKLPCIVDDVFFFSRIRYSFASPSYSSNSLYHLIFSRLKSFHLPFAFLSTIFSVAIPSLFNSLNSLLGSFSYIYFFIAVLISLLLPYAAELLYWRTTLRVRFFASLTLLCLIIFVAFNFSGDDSSLSFLLYTSLFVSCLSIFLSLISPKCY